jgi:tRNA U34 5-methylaminomethyl-2-thiouridine-forming methyltransferase MnmC
MFTMNSFSPQLTDDGSYTFFSETFGQTFHSSYGAKKEALYKYAIATNLAVKAQERSHLRLLDVCYGLGYNSAAALSEIWRVNPECHVEIIGLEIDRTVPIAAIKAGLLADWPEPIPQLLGILADRQESVGGALPLALRHENCDRLQAQLQIGDARQLISAIIQQNFQADAIFLDPFSPTACPQLWTMEFLALVAQCCAPDGMLATYSCAAAVRTALVAGGLAIADSEPIGRKAPGTIASPNPDLIPPLNIASQEHLQTRAAIPYRDPDLSDSAAQILVRRTMEQNDCHLESTSQWKKRWYPDRR